MLARTLVGALCATSTLALPSTAQVTCPDAAVATLGGGTAGSMGVPLLAIEGSPIVGQPLRLRVVSARGGSFGLTAFGATSAPVPLPAFGAVGHPSTPYAALVPFSTNAAGRSTVVLLSGGPLPASLCGAAFVAQAVLADPAAVGGLAFTPGLAVTVGEGREPRDLVLPASRYVHLLSGTSVALGDLDGDGHADLVSGGNDLMVRLGRGDGGFGDPMVEADVYAAPIHLVDYDGDGVLDALYPNNHDELELRIGVGDGTFGPEITEDLTDHGDAVASGDFDGDGLLDVVVALRKEHEVALLLGTGAGSLALPTNFDADKFPNDIAVGDVDGDGDLDLVTANQNAVGRINVLLGDGAGGLAAPSRIDVGSGTAAVELADVDGDGDLDAVVANANSDNVVVLLGDGAGGFAVSSARPVGDRPVALVLADLDADGALDAVTVDETGDTMSVLFGDGNGGFEPSRTWPVGERPYDVAAADLDGDGAPDLASSMLGSHDIAVRLSRPGRSFDGPSLAATLQVSLLGNGFDVGDVDLDGVPDLVVRNVALQGFGVASGQGDGSFAFSFAQTLTKRPINVTVFDADADGVLDVALHTDDPSDSSNDELEIRLGLGDGTFDPTPIQVLSEAAAFRLADMDGDGLQDLLLPSGSPYDTFVALAVGDGTFATPQPLAIGMPQIARMAIADFDNDGDLDIVFRDGQFDPLGLWLGNGDGTGQIATIPFVQGLGCNAFASADLDGDGLVDVVGASGDSNDYGFAVFLNQGGGAFTIDSVVVTRVEAFDVRLVDIDGDAVLDIVGLEPGANRVVVVLGEGGGAFGEPRGFGVEDRPTHMSIADVDGDGMPDLVVGCAGQDANGNLVNRVVVLDNRRLF